MTLQEKLFHNLQEAIKKRDTPRRDAIRLVLAGLKNAEIDRGASLEEADVLGVIAKEVRQHKESIEAFTQGNRPDLVAKEKAELAVLLDYLPRQLSREEILSAAQQVMTEVGAQGPKDKGKVMSHLMPQLKGRADGREVNEVVTELLSAQR